MSLSTFYSTKSCISFHKRSLHNAFALKDHGGVVGNVTSTSRFRRVSGSWHDAPLRRTPEIIPRVGSDGGNRMHRSTLPSITTKLSVPRPRQPLFHVFSQLLPLHRIFNIGRKHKAHREQLAQGKPWRETEKGRGKGKGKGRRSKMGNEESRVVDADTPPQTLKARTVEALAQYIKDGRARQIVVMVRHISVQQITIANEFRRAQESAHQLAYQTSDHQKLDFMPTSRA